MKMARCIVELERIYGIYHGNHINEKSNNFTSKTQTGLASELNMTKQQLHNFKQLNDLIPELQELVETNQLKATTAYKIWAKMNKEEQEKLFNEIKSHKRFSPLVAQLYHNGIFEIFYLGFLKFFFLTLHHVNILLLFPLLLDFQS